jgi:hypothetical protein
MPETSTRRDFTKTLAFLAAAPTAAAAQEPSAKPSALDSTADALVDIARIRYGKNISGEQMKEIRDSVLHSLMAAERLRRVPLHNGDEPAVIFSAEVE